MQNYIPLICDVKKERNIVIENVSGEMCPSVFRTPFRISV